ncbi:uncharacterized protein HGUI_00532 [Hanseniaspora guilliermondii]|uniref:PCI domain-containing protein n=1 Tax=Hanseniaspora guilliermondii TaxID=56406 RepID=A0A1L0AXP2_9ASCO|nr:uncharacterized protein HGUI_00532 [Hanseniaspora guilliermondii]
MEIFISNISKGQNIPKFMSIDLIKNQYINILKKKINDTKSHKLKNDALKLTQANTDQINDAIHCYLECIKNLDYKNSFNNIPYMWDYFNSLLSIVLNIETFPPKIASQFSQLFHDTLIYVLNIFDTIDLETNSKFELKENLGLAALKILQLIKPLSSFKQQKNSIYDDFETKGNNKSSKDKKLPFKHQLLISILPAIIKSFKNNGVYLKTIHTNIPMKLRNLDEYNLNSNSLNSLVVIDYYRAIWMLVNNQDVLESLKIQERVLSKYEQLSQLNAVNATFHININMLIDLYTLTKLLLDEYIISEHQSIHIINLVKIVKNANFYEFDKWLELNKKWLLTNNIYYYVMEKMVLVMFKNALRYTVICTQTNKLKYDHVNVVLKKLICVDDLKNYTCQPLKIVLELFMVDNGWIDMVETLISLNYIKGNVVSKLKIILLINDGSTKDLRQVMFPNVLIKLS